MFSDEFPIQPTSPKNEVSIGIVTNNVEPITFIHYTLSKVGELLLALQETPWSPAYVIWKYGKCCL